MPEQPLSRAAKIKLFSYSVRHRGPSKNPNMSKEQKRLVDKATERSRYLSFAQTLNGSGHYADEKFRQFVMEYNNRVLLGRGDQLPSSFQVMQDFVEPDDIALILKIRHENYFSVNANTILDAATSPSTSNTEELMTELREGEIYHIDIIKGLDGLAVGNTDALTLFGAAFIRQSSEISIFSLFGRFGDKHALDEVEVDKSQLHPDKYFLYPASGKMNPSRDDLFNIEGAYLLVLITRVDLVRGSSLVRLSSLKIKMLLMLQVMTGRCSLICQSAQ